MNAPLSDNTRPLQLTSRQLRVEEYLQAQTPLAPSWSEEDIVRAGHPEGRGRLPLSWSVAMAWLCGVAAGVLVTIGAQQPWSAPPSPPAARQASSMPRHAIAEAQQNANENSEERANGRDVEGVHSFVGYAPVAAGINEYDGEVLYAGAIWQLPNAHAGAAPIAVPPRDADHSGGSESTGVQRDLPRLTPSPAMQRELLRRFGGTNVASLVR